VTSTHPKAAAAGVAAWWTPPIRVPDTRGVQLLTAARFVRVRVVSKSHGAGSEAEALTEAGRGCRV